MSYFEKGDPVWVWRTIGRDLLERMDYGTFVQNVPGVGSLVCISGAELWFHPSRLLSEEEYAIWVTDDHIRSPEEHSMTLLAT